MIDKIIAQSMSYELWVMSYELLSEVEVACRRERSRSMSSGGYSEGKIPE